MAQWTTDTLVVTNALLTVATGGALQVNKKLAFDACWNGVEAYLVGQGTLPTEGLVVSGGSVNVGAAGSSAANTLTIQAGGTLATYLSAIRVPQLVIGRASATQPGELITRMSIIVGNVTNGGLLTLGSRISVDHGNHIEGTYTQTETGVLQLPSGELADSNWGLIQHDHEDSYYIPSAGLSVRDLAYLDGTLRFAQPAVFDATINSGDRRMGPRTGPLGLWYGDMLRYNALVGRFKTFDNPVIRYRYQDAQGKSHESTSTERFLGLDYQQNYLSVITIETPRLFQLVGSGSTGMWTDRDPNGTEDHPRFRLTDPGRSQKKNLILIAPGSAATADTWVAGMAQAMAQQAIAVKGGSWDVVTFEWKEYNTGNEWDNVSVRERVGGDEHVWRPWTAANLGINIGESLATWLKAVGRNDYEYIHLLSHSAGVWLVDAVADTLKAQGSTAFVHLTLFDAFTPQGNNLIVESFARTWKFEEKGPIRRWGDLWPLGLTSLADKADYAEHYVDKRPSPYLPAVVVSVYLPFRLSGLPFTNESLPNCHNIDVSKVADDFRFVVGTFSGAEDYASLTHALPHRFYGATAQQPAAAPTGIGFPYSQEWSGKRPVHDVAHPRGGTTTLPAGTKIPSLPMWHLLKPTAQTIKSTPNTDGTLRLNPSTDADFRLQTGPSGYASATWTFDLTREADVLSFGYKVSPRFDEGSGFWLRIDDQDYYAYSHGTASSGVGWFGSTILPKPLAAGLHKVDFILAGAGVAATADFVGFAFASAKDVDARQISIGSATRAEEDSGVTYFEFPLELSNPSPAPITVKYRTSDGLAKAGEDYTAVTSGTLVIAPNDPFPKIRVAIKGDKSLEPNEDFYVTLTSVTGAAILVPKGKGTILNDDAPSVSIGSVSKAEGNSGTTTFQFPVTLSGPTTKTVFVTYDVTDGTAKVADKDYTKPNTTSIMIPAGQIQGTIAVQATGDKKVEQNEYFSVTLRSVTNATINTAKATAKGTLWNDDPPTVSISNKSQYEGQSGTTIFKFQVTLSAPTTAPVTIKFQTADGTTLNRSAKAGEDYVAITTGSITIPAQQTVGWIEIQVKGDGKREEHEDFFVLLTSATKAILSTTARKAKGTILNDD